MTRSAALATSAAALSCLSATGGVSDGGSLIGTVLMTAAELLTARRTPALDRVLRQYVLPLALLLCTAPAVPSLIAANGDPDLLRSAAARLAAGALVVLPLGGATRRDLLARLALAAATAGLAVSVSDQSRSVAVPVVLFAVTALGLLALLEHDRVQRAAALSGHPGSDRTPGSRRPVILVPTLVALLLTTALTGLLITNVHLSPRNGGFGSRAAGSGGGGRLNADTGAMDLRRRDALPSTPVARVETDEPLLWRSSVLTRYDGSRWSATDDSDVQWRGRTRTDTVVPLGAGPGDPVLLLSPGQPRSTEPATLLSLGFGAAYQLPARTYSVDSVAVDAADVPPTAIDALTYTPAAVRLPEVPARVQSLARRLTAGAATRQEAVERVVTYLRTNYRYRLDSAVPPSGEDAVDDFLFVTREGFCEQFASAAAVLLRSVGIPARLAVGYAGGEPTVGGRLLRGTDAHAWVEVEYPGAGWVAVDPTAGTQLATGDGRLGGWWSMLRRYGGDAGLVVLLGIAVGGVLVAGVRWARSGRRRPDPLARALARLNRRLGVGRQAPGETLREFGGRLALTPAETAALLVVEDDRYAARRPGASERQQAAALIDRITERVRPSRRAQALGRTGLRRRTDGR